MTATNNWQTLPLAGHGRSLVEASAGTGKTWTIAVLYLRLLLEQGLTPRRIIVATFTKAAAAELGERLRARLLWALDQADRQRANQYQAKPITEADGASDTLWLRRRWHDPDLRENDVARLQAALSELDAAPIATLHGLCSRILAEHPFAAGAPFRGREIIDTANLASRLADDLWRLIAQDETQGELARLAGVAGIERKALQKLLPTLLLPGLVVAAEGPIDLHAQLRHLPFLDDVDAWAKQAEALVDRCTTKTAKLRKAWTGLIAALRAPLEDTADLMGHLAAFDKLDESTGINKAGSADPAMKVLIDQTRAILAALPWLELDLRGPAPKRRFLLAAQRWCQQALQAQLDAAGQSSFDQLVSSVHKALKPKDGQRALADALFEAWPAALVDEFQDTDPQQFALLDAIYRDAEGLPRGRLVMIGDPKQAIYRFRGGDVAAYENAKARIAPADRLSLDTNFRSSRAYVEAVNAFYAATGTRLAPPDSPLAIHYESVQASGRRDDTPLLDTDRKPLRRPLVLHELDADTDDHELEAHALRCCAGQITALLSQPGCSLGAEPLKPGDIAVLLPGHAQIAQLAALLKARGVPCVTGSQASVFESDAARELRVLLHAALHADNPRALRAAVSSRLWGGDLRELQRLRQEPAALDGLAARFQALHSLLERRGPLGLVAALLEQQAGRLLETREGERLLTDLRHLGELLQERWQDHGGGERLLAWFAQQATEGSDGAEAGEARALRLESDVARVKLMTLHASKGLEFEIVFLPLMWKHGARRNKKHDPQLLAGHEPGLRCLVEGDHCKALVDRQEHEERFRLLYVALTRAIHACHLFVVPKGRVKDGVPLKALDLTALKADAASGLGAIELVQGWAEHAGLDYRSGESEATPRRARPLPAAPRGPLPLRHSFTTLSRSHRRRANEEERAAEDEAPLVAEALVPEQDTIESAPETASASAARHLHSELDALAAVGGTEFGHALHALFERRLPGIPVSAAEALDALREHAVRPRHGELAPLAEALAHRVNRVLHTRLAEPEGPRLWDLSAQDMRAEMGFSFLLDRASLAALREACERHGEAGLVPRREQSLAGLMSGTIDLVFAQGERFHLLDYKGNQLARGPRACLEDYAPEALERAMHVSGYRFQALLYTLALERYLRERLGTAYRRERHLGDGWYLFVRAVGLRLPDGTACGVWRHRFSDALLDAVQAVFTAQPEAA